MLKASRIVVLGGSAGIGLAVAQQAAQHGAEVVIASSSAQRLAAARASLPAATQTVVADLTDAAATKKLFAQVGAFDHLVFTAGEPLVMGPLATLDLDTARRFFELRYWGAVTAVKHAAGQLRRGGSIVLTGGIAAQRPHAGWTIGASICGAMEALTRALAVELAPQGLRVNLVSPGIIETGLWSNLTDAARGELYRGVAAALPVGRVGRPADVAAIYVALMANGFATGQSYVVDGGGLLV